MRGEQPYLPEPGADERSIIDEMIRNPSAKHWEKCSTFVTSRVYSKARNILRSDQEEIIQEIMYKVTRYLPSFRFECTFRSWLYQIIEHCIADKYRKLQNEEWHHLPFMNPIDEKGNEGEEFNAIEEKSTEEVFEMHEQIRDGIAALFRYASSHSNPLRDRRIIKMVILEGHTYVETATAVGCDVGVVGYVVREAQRYVRKKRD